MSTLKSKPITAFIMVCTLMIFSSAAAYDASMVEFQWNYPAILTSGTPVVQYSFRLQFGPSPCPFDCYYNTQLYLSRDRTWSTDDFALFGPIETLLITGSVGFSATVTRPMNPGFSLPAYGTYYVFIRLSPGTGAPTDTNNANNVAMAANPIQVQVVTPTPTQLNTATVVTASGTGRSTLVTGYSDGLLEFRDWQGTILSTRSGFGQITALAAGVAGSPPAPRLFVVSTDTGGTLRAVDLANINRNIASRSNLGAVSAMEICGGSDGAIYIGTNEVGGTLRKLNILTLADQNMRRNMGTISRIVQLRGSWSDVLAVGSDSTGGSVYLVNRDTLSDVVARRQNLGRIYALSSGDMDQDGQAELVIATDASGGSIRLREGPNFSSNLAMQTGLGEIYTLDYGPVGAESFAEPVGSAWLFFAADSKGGSLNAMYVNVGPSNATLQNWTSASNLGPVRYVELHDFYTVDTALVGAVWEGAAGPSLRVMDENLIESGTSPIVSEGFETGDFSRYPWQRSGNANWTIASQQRNSGLYSARAGTINHNGSTSLQVRLACVSGNITFYRKVSSEANYDFLRFYIDGIQKESWSGEMDWAMMSFPVTAGTRTFTWTYSKDYNVSRGSDTAWIDDIVFPTSSSSWSILSSFEDEEHAPFEQPVQIDIQYE